MWWLNSVQCCRSVIGSAGQRILSSLLNSPAPCMRKVKLKHNLDVGDFGQNQLTKQKQTARTSQVLCVFALSHFLYLLSLQTSPPFFTLPASQLALKWDIPNSHPCLSYYIQALLLSSSCTIQAQRFHMEQSLFPWLVVFALHSLQSIQRCLVAGKSGA